MDTTTGLFSPKGGGALTPQDITQGFRSGEIQEGPAIQALTKLFGGNANSARAYFNGASKGQNVSISQQNGVWSPQTNRPPPLDTNKQNFAQDLEREIFGNDFALNRDSFRDFFGETQEGRGQLFRGALANSLPRNLASPVRGFLERQFPRFQNEFFLDLGTRDSSSGNNLSFEDFVEKNQFLNFGNAPDKLRQVAGLFDRPRDSLSNTQQGLLEFLNDPSNGFNLALQSALPGVASPFRRSFSNVAQRNFDRDFFNKPEANFLEEFANRGFRF